VELHIALQHRHQALRDALCGQQGLEKREVKGGELGAWRQRGLGRLLGPQRRHSALQGRPDEGERRRTRWQT